MQFVLLNPIVPRKNTDDDYSEGSIHIHINLTIGSNLIEQSRRETETGWQNVAINVLVFFLYDDNTELRQLPI